MLTAKQCRLYFIAPLAIYSVAILGVNGWASDMNFVDRKHIVDKLSNDKDLVAAIHRSTGRLDEFREAYVHRHRWQDQFLATVVVQEQGELRPLGILITDLTESGVRGRIIRNGRFLVTNDVASCSWTEIIDWRYRDVMELKGGDVFRFLYARASPVEKRAAEERMPILLRTDDSSYPKLRRVRQGIARGRNLLWQACAEEIKDEVYRSVVPRHEFDRRACFPREDDFSLGELICLLGNEEAVQLAIQKKLLKEEVRQEYSPLEYACLSGNVEAAKVLLEAGYSADFVDGASFAPVLLTASASGSAELVELLIKHGADVNSVDILGRTAIFLAPIKDVASSLVRHGADLHLRDARGGTASGYALEEERFDVVAYLKERGAPAVSAGVNDEASLISNNDLIELLEDSVVGFSGSDRADFIEMLSIDYGAVLPTRCLGGQQEDGDSM